MIPAVAESTLIVADFGAAPGCSGPEGDLLQLASAINAAANRKPKPLKHGGKEETEEICLIFDIVKYL
jgi:hypothetical protein